MKLNERFGPAGIRYLAVTVLFVLAMIAKVMIDKPWENNTVAAYIVSTLIVIPIVWYAGYFFRQAEEHARRRSSTDRAPLS